MDDAVQQQNLTFVAFLEGGSLLPDLIALILLNIVGGFEHKECVR